MSRAALLLLAVLLSGCPSGEPLPPPPDDAGNPPPLDGGTCGGASACDDGNVCTVDRCIAARCVHVSEPCETENPCLTASCDATLGCRTSAMVDGTTCGPSDCSRTSVCRAGVCTTESTQEGALCHPSPCLEGHCSAGVCAGLLDRPVEPRVLYQFQPRGIPGRSVASATRAGQIVVLHTTDGGDEAPQVLASVALDGGRRWYQEVAGAPPFMADRRLYRVIATDHAAVAYLEGPEPMLVGAALDDGTPLWKLPLSQLVDPQSLVGQFGQLGDVFIAAAGSRILVAAVALSAGSQFCTTNDVVMVAAVDDLTGTVAWSRPLQTCYGKAGLIADLDGSAYVSRWPAGPFVISALDSDGGARWETTAGSAATATAHGLVGTVTGELFSAASGTLTAATIGVHSITSDVVWGPIDGGAGYAAATLVDGGVLTVYPISVNFTPTLTPLNTLAVTPDGWMVETWQFTGADGGRYPALIGKATDGGTWTCAVRPAGGDLALGPGSTFRDRAFLVGLYDPSPAVGPVFLQIISVDVPGLSQAPGDWVSATGGRQTSSPW